MTESEWLGCQTRPNGMVTFIQRKASYRKLQLIACGVCRLTNIYLTDQRFNDAIRAMEQHADGELSNEEFVKIRASTWELPCDYPKEPFDYEDKRQIGQYAALAITAALNPDVRLAASGSIYFVTMGTKWMKPKGQWKQANMQLRQNICAIVHEIIGNPFQKWSQFPPWFEGALIQPDGKIVRTTDTVRGLSETIHQLQAFDRLPILADALEEAGITDAALLAHCRSEQPHIRGCWALDVVRGKT